MERSPSGNRLFPNGAGDSGEHTEGIREKQKQAVLRMLNLHKPIKHGQEPVWKVLIFDRQGQDIISPLIKVGQLREMGVTLYLLIHGDREPIPDVPAVYFVLPTHENLRRIEQDMKQNMYEAYHLNFISNCPRAQLEDLANSAVEADSVAQIAVVYDQYINFLSLEEDLFVLRQQQREAISYYALNNPAASDTDIVSGIEQIVDSLFSVLVTSGTIPIIRCPKGSAAGDVGERLCKRLHDHLKNTRANLFAEAMSSMGNIQRPVMIITDREMDLATMLHHTWTYQALVHDVLDLNLNRVNVGIKIENNVTKKSYDLDSASDPFWNNNKGKPFPEVAGEIESELNEYKSKSAHITALSGAMGNLDDADGGFSSTQQLTNAISDLPQLTEWKRRIDMHTNILSALIECIKDRTLDTYFESEEKLLGGATNVPLEFFDGGTPEDHVRLLCIYYIMMQGNVDQAAVDRYIERLQDSGADLAPFEYLKQMQEIKRMTAMPLTDSQNVGGDGSSSYFSKFTSKLVDQGSTFLQKGVKNILMPEKDLPLTRLTSAVMNGSQSMKQANDLQYLDPRAQNPAQAHRARSAHKSAMVFVVGSGNYVEYQNLMNWAKHNERDIRYGTTELLNANQFMKQLGALGRQIQ
eukprot:Clim_evm18s156 gene=Clim_evmTU18s156